MRRLRQCHFGSLVSLTAALVITMPKVQYLALRRAMTVTLLAPLGALIR